MSAVDPSDPQRHLVYAAEDAVITEIGPALPRWRDVEAFLESVLTLPEYLDEWPDAPLDIELARRSRSARSSYAVPGPDVISIRDGSWNALTVLHELAHLVVGTRPAIAPHGPAFVDTELRLVRMRCGFDQYGILLNSLRRHGVKRSS